MVPTCLELSVLSFASVLAGEASNHALWAEIKAVEQADALSTATRADGREPSFEHER
jgi:hypothetical protein